MSLKEWCDTHGEPYGMRMSDFEREESTHYCPEHDGVVGPHEWNQEYGMCTICLEYLGEEDE